MPKLLKNEDIPLKPLVDRGQEKQLIQGELKWTAGHKKEDYKEECLTEKISHEKELNQEQLFQIKFRWPWFGFYATSFFVSFLVGYVFLGKQYWREVFDIHTWIHLIRLLFL